MKLIIICALSTLAMSVCPPQLENTHLLDKDWKPQLSIEGFSQFRDAADTSCGKTNFTTAFWESELSHETMTFLALDAVNKETHASASSEMQLLQPLVDSLFEKFKSLENEEAKNYVDAMFANQYQFRMSMKDLAASGGLGLNMGSIFKMSFGQSRLDLTPLSINARVALMQTMKSAFGFEETPEMKKDRIDVAMKALERIESGPFNATAISELIEKIQSLTNDTSFVPQSKYRESFAEWMTKNENFTGIGPMEVVPAVEVLYLQYNTLKNTEAKDFIETFLSSWKAQYEKQDSPPIQEKEKVSFDSLSDEARSALATTFPELFNYLEKNDKIEKKNAKSNSGIF